jgi:hypothetical protein
VRDPYPSRRRQLCRRDPRPSAFQAGHIPSRNLTCERRWVLPTADACRWLPLLLSPLLSGAAASDASYRSLEASRERLSCPETASCPPAPCRGWPAPGPGRLPPGPCLLTGVSAESSRVKRDFACTFTRHFPPVLVALRSQSCLRLEGRTRTLSGPSPDLSPAKTLAPSVCVPYLSSLHYQLEKRSPLRGNYTALVRLSD